MGGGHGTTCTSVVEEKGKAFAGNDGKNEKERGIINKKSRCFSTRPPEHFQVRSERRAVAGLGASDATPPWRPAA